MVTASPNTRPTVSVVIPTYNWSSALACAHRSVQLQTFRDFEVLVVGDGCTDDSGAVVASFNDPRFKWHNLERNHGSQWAPNNYGLETAAGEWIAYLGHDDLWYPTHLASALQTATTMEADLVAGVMISYGPPESGFRQVSGVFADWQYKPDYFIPPSSLLHRRSLVERIGYWRDHETTEVPVDCEFLQRAAAAGIRIVSTGELSAFKFNAAWRRDAYKRKDTSEQESMLSRIESGTDFRQEELMGVLQAVVAQRFNPSLMPPEGSSVAGVMKRYRSFKGVEKPYRPEALQKIDKPTRFDLTDIYAPFEWRELETSEQLGTFRWSGPLRTSTIDLPVRADHALSVAVHVLKVLTPQKLIGRSKFSGLKLFLNNQPAEFTIQKTPHRSFLLKATALQAREPDSGLRISFEVEQPAQLGDSSTEKERRPLRIAVNWIEVAPAPQEQD